MTHTRPYDNDTPQAERRQIVKNDSYFARQSDTVEDSGGRFAKLTPTKVTGSTPLPQVPQLPASSPWSSGFDQNVEPALGFSVDEMPAPAVSIPEEPTPSVASSAGVGSVEPVALPSVVLAATEAKSLTGSTTIKRKRW
jgi:hypothetical protein